MKDNILHKQIFYFALINYLGTAIGIISALFIYPLDFAFSGTVKFIDNVAQLLYPVMVLGASHALIKFYPLLADDKRKQLFNYSMVSVAVASIIVFAGVLLFNTISNDEEGILVYISLPIALSLAYIDVFRKQAQDLQKLAVPTLYEKLIPKIVLPVLFLLIVNKVLPVYTSLYFYAACYLLVFLLTGIYLFKRYKPGFNYRFKTLFGEISRKDYFRYSLYSFAGSLGSLLAFRIDGIIIYKWISEEANGIFSNGVVLASTLQIPAVGLFALYAPIISNYLKSGNLPELNRKYKETAKLLLFIGILLYSCIVLGIGDLFSLLPAGDALKKTIPVIFILGCSVLFNMATGFNTEIISYSKYYKFNMIAILLLIIVNVGLNIFFFKYTSLSILGVAWASFISMGLFNVAKLAFIYKKFKMHPFSTGYAKVILVFTFTGFAVYLLPDTNLNVVNLIYKTGLCLIINTAVVYRLKLVPQVNEWINKSLAKIRRF